MSAARLLLALTLALAALPLPARGQADATIELTEAALVERDAAVEVWVRLTRPAKYQAELMDGPWRLVLDFEDTAYRWMARPLPVEADPVRELRGSQYRKGQTRLVIELRRKAPYLIEEDREGLRIVLTRQPGLAAGPPAPSPPGAVPPPAVVPLPTPGPAVAMPGARVAPVPPPGPRPAPKEPLVYGIVMLNEQRHAYIFDPAVQQVRRYAVGDALGNGVIETIGEGTVVVRTPSGRLELRVEDGKSDGAPAKSPPAAQQRR